MNPSTLRRILALGAITGMRSMAGAATLAAQYGWALRSATAMAAMGEMVADKTALVGNRTDALPQTSRAAMGALVGGLVAHDERQAVWLGALIGAATAVAATHIAYQVRTRLPLSTATSGLIEDSLVIALGLMYTKSDRRRNH